MKKAGPKKKQILFVAPWKKGSPSRKRQRLLVWPKCLRQSRHLLKIWSIRLKIRVFLKLSVNCCFSAVHFPPLTSLALVLPLTLASLPIILRCRPELNSTERDKKRVAM